MKHRFIRDLYRIGERWFPIIREVDPLPIPAARNFISESPCHTAISRTWEFGPNPLGADPPGKIT